MTAAIGNTANVYTGIREQSQVTNSYGGYITSAGAAYTLSLPFFPDKFEWFNFTKYGTNTNNISGVWFRDFPTNDALIITRGTTTLTSTLEATNGVANASLPGGFTNQHLLISNITTATPGVVTTTTNHNLSNNDRVVITKVIGTMAQVINNNTYVVQVLSATTFALYDVFGVPITLLGAYSSSGQVTKIGPLLGDVTQPVNPAYPQQAIIDYPPLAQLTLGTAIMGAASDVIYFTAWQFNNYVNRGVA
jgi:hypothetical protein